MLTHLNRHLVLPLLARKRRSRHLEFLNLLERTQYDPPEVLRARQLVQLRRVLHHAYETVPFYQKTWTAAGIHPSDFHAIADLQHFPILTKSLLRAAGPELHSSKPLAASRTKTTSGSTGVPLAIRIDEPAVQWKYACTLRSDQWSGYRLGQRVAKVWGNPDYRQFGLRGRLMNHFVDRAVYLDTMNLIAERMAEFVRTVRRHRPGLIFGHAHSLYLLAAHLKRQNIDDVRPNGVISTAMPLHQWQRTVIESVFGVPATDRYGCEEVSLIACQCEKHKGLHVAAESVFTEIGPGGKLLVTDLVNFAMPLIRYQTGDVVTASDKPCDCGRGLPLIDSVMGRDADYVLKPDGGLISGISLTENFAMHIAGAAQVQLVQETLTHLRVRLVPDERFTDASRQQIAKLVAAMFGPAMKHEVELVDAIPQEPSGKYRFCISKVATDHLKALSA